MILVLRLKLFLLKLERAVQLVTFSRQSNDRHISGNGIYANIRHRL